jgi:Domain of unknown function (DUF4382)/Carboxypeptidase regulatory-like domain
MQPSPLSKGAGSGQVGKFDVSGGIGPGRLDVAMGDAPPWFSGRTLSHFYIGVREVDAIANGQSTTVLSMGSPYVFDLLSYQDGNALDLGQASVMPANYTQLRFVLDVASAQAIFSDGTSVPVTFLTNNGSNGNRPGASTVTTTDPNVQGAVDVTVNGSFTVGSGDSASFGIDFNALESTALVNNNAMKVRPSLVVASNASAGKITGNIVNQNGAPVQNAVVAAVAADGTIVNTALTGPYGRFNIHHLNAGSYQVVIYNSYTTAGGQSYTASGQTSNAASVSGPTVTVTGGAATATGALAD